MRRRNESGFTILELIVVVMMIATVIPSLLVDPPPEEADEHPRSSRLGVVRLAEAS
jgi:hypothetical protein